MSELGIAIAPFF